MLGAEGDSRKDVMNGVATLEEGVCVDPYTARIQLLTVLVPLVYFVKKRHVVQMQWITFS